MTWIATALALSTALALASPPEPTPEPTPAPATLDGDIGCAAARAVAEMPACLDRESCGAVEAWEELVAPPGLRHAPGPPPAPGPTPSTLPKPAGWAVSTCPAERR